MAVDVAKLIWRPNGLRSLDYSRLLPGDLPVNVETCKKRSRIAHRYTWSAHLDESKNPTHVIYVILTQIHDRTRFCRADCLHVTLKLSLFWRCRCEPCGDDVTHVDWLPEVGMQGPRYLPHLSSFKLEVYAGTMVHCRYRLCSDRPLFIVCESLRSTTVCPPTGHSTSPSTDIHQRHSSIQITESAADLPLPKPLRSLPRVSITMQTREQSDPMACLPEISILEPQAT
ncbi:hypothetical protein HBI47_113550 [Parastagonospora nodorum]|nr:hypothetical protein HBI47_113550 [Parastagonospora nodorum]